MRNKLKLFSFLVVGLLFSVIGLQSSVSALRLYTSNGYINIDSELYKATTTLYNRGVTKLSIGQQPFYQQAKRWEAALLLKRFGVTQLNKSQNPNGSCQFNDISDLSSSISSEVVESCQYGLFNGHNGNFYPQNTFTRGQAIMVIARMLSNDPNKQLNDSYDYLLSQNIINVDDRNNSARGVPRYEMYLMMYRLLAKKGLLGDYSGGNPIGDDTGNEDIDIGDLGDLFGDIDLGEDDENNDDNSGTGDNTGNTSGDNNTGNTSGDNNTGNENDEDVQAILNQTGTDINVANTIDGEVYQIDKLPLQSTKVYLKKIIIKNNTDSEKVLDKVDLELKGLVGNKAIDKVYLVNENGTIVSSKTSFSDSSTYVSIKSTNNYDIIEGGKQKVYYLAIDAGDGNFDSQMFKIKYKLNFENQDDLTFGGSRESETKNYTLIKYDIQIVGVEGYDTPMSKIYVGDMNELVGSFKLTVGSSSTTSENTVKFTRMILTNSRSIDDKITNVVFKDDNNEEIKGEIKLEDDQIIINFEDFKIKDGETKLVNLYADVIGGDGDRIKLTLKNNGDLVGKDVSNDLPVNIELDSSYPYFKEFNIQSGKLTLSKDNTSPIVETISTNTIKEVLRFKINSPSKIELDDFKIFGAIRNNTTSSVKIADILKNLKLYECDKEFNDCNFVGNFSYSDSTVSAGNTEDFEGLISLDEINSGDSYYKVKADIGRYAPSNVEFKVKFDTNSFIDPENVDGDSINQSSMAGSADSNYWSIGDLNLTVSYSNSETSEYVKGKSGIFGGKVVISTNNVKDLKLNNLRLQFSSVDTGFNFNQITNVNLYVENNSIASEDVESNGSVSFDNLGVTIPKDEQLEIEVRFDTSTSLYDGNNVKKLSFSVVDNSSSNILVTSSEGTTLESSNINGLPLISNTFKMYPTGKVYLYKDTNLVDNKVIFDRNEYSEVYSMKVKTKYDDIRLKDVYMVAYTGTYNVNASSTNIIGGTQGFINKVKYLGNKKVETSMIDGIARFENLNDSIKANEELIVKLEINPTNINKSTNDNKKVKFALILNLVDGSNNYKTKFVSLSNGEIVDSASVIDGGENLVGNEMILRKSMVKVSSLIDDSIDNKATNGAEHTIYKFKVENLGIDKVKLKQFALPININNSNNTLGVKEFKVEVSTDGGDSWTNWSNLKNKIEFAAGSNITNADWIGTQTDGSNISFTTAATDSSYLYTRFANSYENGYEINGKDSLQIRIKAILEGFDDTSDSLRIELKDFDKTDLNGAMDAYSVFEQGDGAKNMVIWSDNSESSGNTTVTDINWFEDKSVEGDLKSNTVTYNN